MGKAAAQRFEKGNSCSLRPPEIPLSLSIENAGDESFCLMTDPDRTCTLALNLVSLIGAMECRLTYDGYLHANGRVKETHHIRRIMHRQLKYLWNRLPVTPTLPGLEVISQNPGGGIIPLAFPVGDFVFSAFSFPTAEACRRA